MRERSDVTVHHTKTENHGVVDFQVCLLSPQLVISGLRQFAKVPLYISSRRRVGDDDDAVGYPPPKALVKLRYSVSSKLHDSNLVHLGV